MERFDLNPIRSDTRRIKGTERLPLIADNGQISLDEVVEYVTKTIADSKVLTAYLTEPLISDLPGNALQRDVDGKLFTNASDGEGASPLLPNTIMVNSGEVLLAYRLVTTNQIGELIYADANTLQHQNKTVGVLLQAAAVQGTSVVVQTDGLMNNSGWSFTAQQMLYLGLEGEITPNPYAGVIMQQIGYALTATSIMLRLQPAVRRA